MTYIIVLVSLLVVLAGIISYTGDVLGTIVGKRRLSLFGARPKRSGQIIGVTAGILIMVVTLLVLALAFRNATRVLFNVQSVQEQNAQLSAQQQALNNTVDRLEAQVAAQRDEVERARSEVQAAEASKEEAQAELEQILQQQDSLQAEVDSLAVQGRQLEENFDQAQAELEEAQTALTEAKSDLQSAVDDREQAEVAAKQAQEDVRAAQEKADTLETQVSEAQAQLEALGEEFGTLQTSLTDVQAQLGQRQSELEEAQATLEEVTQARDTALDEVGQLEAAIGQLQVQANELELENDELASENADLQQINSELDAKNLEQLAEISNKNTELLSLRGEVERLSDQVQTQASALELARQAQAGGANLTYTANQALHTGVIDAQDTTEIRTQVARLLATAEDKALRRRASGLNISTEQLDTLVQGLVGTPGADVVTLRSPENQYIDERVQVGLEVTENKMLFSAGELIATRQLHLGSPELQEQRNSVRAELGQLFSSASGHLLSQGLADDVYPVTSETSLEIEGFTNQLLRLSGPVVIGLTAGDDIYTGGPAKLEFIIIN